AGAGKCALAPPPTTQPADDFAVDRGQDRTRGSVTVACHWDTSINQSPSRLCDSVPSALSARPGAVGLLSQSQESPVRLLDRRVTPTGGGFQASSIEDRHLAAIVADE